MALLPPRARATALARSRLFRDMSEAEIAELTAIAREQSVAAGGEIFCKGSRSVSFYVIVSGTVRMDSPSNEGRELMLRSLGPGDVFGEIAVLDRGTRTATARAVEDAVLLAIDGRDFRAYLERRPLAAIKLLEVFAERLRGTTEQLEDNVFLTIEARLGKALLLLAKQSSGAGARQITPPITIVELARQIGTVRERVSKQLSLWERLGAIRRDGRRIEVLDASQLGATSSSRDLE